jgi:hypothetical protein
MPIEDSREADEGVSWAADQDHSAVEPALQTSIESAIPLSGAKGEPRSGENKSRRFGWIRLGLDLRAMLQCHMTRV